ncbi:thioesterase family protein [Nocardioides sp. NPDC006303]|uniref:thioesterase family protein n=1 Tax=Nocardioides sp. NPDC006303 TaxID=3156747 RepID=UPI0033A9C5B1
MDDNGHLRVRGSFDLHMLGCESFFNRLGFDEDYRAHNGLTIFSLDDRLTYVDEVRDGEHVTVHVCATSASDSVVRGRSAIVNQMRRAVASVLYFVDASAGLHSRRLEPFADPLAGEFRPP